ncbi:MAG: CHAT domain-containing protein [Actinomycetota bacterium]|nr:CHAT domain-containing protein [Actinomycetota bacterium]
MSGVEELTAELGRRVAGTPEFDEACADLCLAYLQRAVDHDSPADLDLAVRAGEGASDPGDPWVRHALAWAYGCRWDLAADTADRDRAIVHWLAVLEVVEDPAGLTECGRLLGERGDSGKNIGDASASIDLLERAVAAGEGSWWYLGNAYLLRWRLAHDVDDLRRATRNLDRGLADPPSREWLIRSWVDRLTVARELLEAETAADPARTPPSATELLQLVAEARQVWQSGVGEPGDRARLAGVMGASSLIAAQAHPDSIDAAWVREMAEAARGLRDAPPGWDQQMTTMQALAMYTQQARAGGKLPEDALDTLVGPLRDGTAGDGLATELQGVATLFMAARALQSGDRRSLRTAVDRLLASAEEEDRLLGTVVDVADRAQHGEALARDDLAGLVVRVRAEPLSYVARQVITPLLTMIESAVTGNDGTYRPVDRTPIATGDVPTADRALQALIGPMQAARTRHDVAALRECADRFDELLAVFPPGHLLRLVALGLAALAGDSLLHDEPGDQDAARRMLRWTEEGLRVAAGPHHPRWSSFALSRGAALRHLDGGDRAESRRCGLAALQGLAWQVLLQSGTDDAVLMAGQAGTVARRVAGWCQADGAIDDLIATLDTGRGLVLHAATASRTVAERLTEAGHPDLAEQWRESAGYGRDAVTGDPLNPDGATGREVPDELRAQAMRVLDLSSPTPASTAEIRAGLAATGSDALIYLIPSSVEQPGAAILVPKAGEPSTLLLPGLITGPGSRLAETAARVRDAGPADDDERPEAGPDDLCRWAWRSAMDPLLHRSGLRRDDGGPLRLVLVPTGSLSSVPWHAAFRADGEQRRYAIEEAVFSYAVSGRAFVESSREPARTVKTVLIVGDPTGDLPFAGEEAQAIGAAFYPDAVFAGSPREVLDWIGASAPGPSLLHLACHGRTDPARPADASLRLAGGDLTARRLLDASRTAELEIEQVFLAACTTGLTGVDHDEAFSLATAFLAAGARTAFGSLWPVPDAETSALMFMVHHHLAAGHAPADALHRAQLWMLDPQRVTPAGMPPALARHCTGSAPAAPRCWAAFTHQGR